MSADRVDILSDSTGELVASCYGPTAVGSCPHADSRGVVACAGCRIAPLPRGRSTGICQYLGNRGIARLPGRWSMSGCERAWLWLEPFGPITAETLLLT
jgi:hypothetical protein